MPKLKKQNLDTRGLVSQRIELARKKKCLTQLELGKLIGVSAQQIQKYESGKDSVSYQRLKELSLKLDVKASYFFEENTAFDKNSKEFLLDDTDLLLLQELAKFKDEKSKRFAIELIKLCANLFKD